MDRERTVRELGRVSWEYHSWWHKYDDEIVAAIESKFGKEAPKKIREYRKARSQVMTALTDLASFVNEATEE